MKVLRSILAVVVGYIVMAVIGMALFFGLAMALGVDGAYQPGTYKASMTVNVSAIAISIVIALAGGLVCGKIARTRTPVLVFAAIVVVFGLILAILGLNKEAPGPRPPNATLMEVMQNAREPNWFAFINPFLGAGGVLVGGRLAQRRKPAP